MARVPDSRVGQAKEMFLAGKKLIEIAEALSVPEGTVRSWKKSAFICSMKKRGIK